MMHLLASAADLNPTSIAITVIGAGGVGGVLIGLLKVRREGDSIVVTAAQGALVVQSGVLDEVQEELARSRLTNDALQKTNDALNAELHDTSTKLIDSLNENRMLIAENQRWRERVGEFEQQNVKISDENKKLRERVDELEQRVEKLQNGQR